MPKRKSKKSLSETILHDDYDSDDTTSSAATGSSSLAMSRTMSQLSMGDVSIENQLDDWIEELTEKRGSTRESALVKLVRALSTQYLQSVVSSRMDTIVSILCKSLKKDGQEGILSAKSLTLVWITCGDSPELCVDTVKVLKDCIRNSSEDVRAVSMSALGMIVFLEDVPNSTVVEILDYIQSVIESRDIPAVLMQSALDAYGLLYLKSTSRPDREEFNVLMDRHMELLEADELDVRVSAGENIALFLEDHEENIKGSGMLEDESYFERYHELVSTLNGMTNENAKHKSKKDRSMQRATFRDIAQSVESGVPPEFKMQFKSETIHFNDWGKIRRYEAFRQAIGEGLNVHFHENPLVQDYFEFTENYAKGMDKRLLDITMKKSRSVSKKELRAAKHSSRQF